MARFCRLPQPLVWPYGCTRDPRIDAIRLNVILNVSDFDTSVAFYRDVLGLRVTDTWIDGDDGPGCILEAGAGRTVELFGPPYGARVDKRIHAGTEISFEVGDVEAWHERVQRAGVEVKRVLKDNPWGDRSFGIDDPDGMRIWILETTG